MTTNFIPTLNFARDYLFKMELKLIHVNKVWKPEYPLPENPGQGGAEAALPEITRSVTWLLIPGPLAVAWLSEAIHNP